MIVKEINVKEIMSRSNLPVSDYSVNPYVGCSHACKYCYASFMKRFTNHPEPWGDFVDVKFWEPIKNREKYRGKEAFFSGVTDPYQPLEAKYKRTRQILEELSGTGIRISISTKSDLIRRDLELIKSFEGARVSWSINTLDEDFRKQMDRGVSIERRLKCMKEFYDAGIDTTFFISPIFPGITDVKALIDESIGKCNLVWLENLNLRGDYKPRILSFIHENHPELDDLYHQIYTKKDRTYWKQLDEEIREYCANKGLRYYRNDDTKRAKHGEDPIVVNYFYHEEVRKNPKEKK